MSLITGVPHLSDLVRLPLAHKNGRKLLPHCSQVHKLTSWSIVPVTLHLKTTINTEGIITINGCLFKLWPTMTKHPCQILT